METRSCDVCTLIYRDKTPKETRYCPRCKAWLCDGCRRNWWGRASAALIVALTGRRAE
jgi:hypothetical protein